MKYSASTGGFYAPAIHGDNIPADAVEIPAERHAELLAGQSSGKRIIPDASGRPILADPPPPTEAEIVAALTAVVQAHLDDTARQRSYDGILSLCSYATSTAPRFAAEGRAGVAWRDAVWATCYAIMDDVTAGNRPIPTAAELLAELPAFAWPA